MKVSYYAGGIGKSETFTYQLILGLKDIFDLQVLTDSDPFYTDGYSFKQVKDGLHPKIVHYANYFFGVRGKKLIFNFRRRKAFKLCLSHLKNTDAIYIEYGTNAVRLLPLLKELGKPFVVHFHGYDITSELSMPYYKLALNNLFKLEQSKFIAASHHIKRLLIINGCPSEKIEVIRLGVALPDNVTVLPLEEKEIDFVFIGRLTPKKCPQALIRAFNIVRNKLPTVNLHIVGDGELLSECKQLVKQLGLEESVVFYGGLSHEKAMDILCRAKIYVQHSVTSLKGDQEGFAISLSEAAKLRIPVVSTLHNGIPENVLDNKTGFLVREYDFETMGEKMLELIQNPELMKQMGDNAYEYITDLCQEKVRSKSIANLIKNLPKR